MSASEFVQWLFSASPSAMAVRFAFLDHFMSRYGRIAATRHAALKRSEALEAASTPGR
jgi:hypothetical protein